MRVKQEAIDWILQNLISQVFRDPRDQQVDRRRSLRLYEPQKEPDLRDVLHALVQVHCHRRPSLYAHAVPQPRNSTLLQEKQVRNQSKFSSTVRTVTMVGAQAFLANTHAAPNCWKKGIFFLDSTNHGLSLNFALAWHNKTILWSQCQWPTYVNWC